MFWLKSDPKTMTNIQVLRNYKKIVHTRLTGKDTVKLNL